MKYNKNWRIGAICEKANGYREPLRNPHLKGEWLRATNGHMAICINIERGENDIDGYIPMEALKAGSAMAPKNGEFDIELNGSAKLANGATFERPDGQFPDLGQVIPHGEPTFKIGLNADYLQSLAAALNGSSRGPNNVSIEFHGDTGVMLIRGRDTESKSFGLLMPVTF